MASTVLATIQQLCGEMKEAQVPCERLHRRLADMFHALQTLETTKKLPPTEALGRYAAMLRKFREFLRRYRSKPLYARVVAHEALMASLRQFHEEMDGLGIVLGIGTDASQWMDKWTKDCVTTQHVLEGVVENLELGEQHELRDRHAHLEVMTVLRYETSRTTTHSSTTIALVDKLYAALVRLGCDEIERVPSWFLTREDVEYDRTPFAQGSFGAVHRGTLRSGGKAVVKILCVDDSGMVESARAQFVGELDRWFALDHRNVLNMLGACHVASPPFIICEEAPLGNAASYLGSAKRRDTQMWKLLRDAAVGLQYLHMNGITHGELRLSNILVDAGGSPRLADFGLTSVRTLSAESPQKSTSRGGRLRWRAPERLKRKPTTYSDIYALAMCIVEAATGAQPFAFVDDDTVYRLLRDGELFERPDELSERAWELVLAMTRKEPTDRISLDEVIDELAELDAIATSAGEDPWVNVSEDACEPPATELDADEAEALTEDIVCGEQMSVITVDEHTNTMELLKIIQLESSDCQDLALGWLYRKCYDPSDCETIHRSDGVAKLAEIATNCSTRLSSALYACGCLRRIAASVDGADITAISDATSRVPVPSTAELFTILEPLTQSVSNSAEMLHAVELVACLAGGSVGASRALVQEGILQLIVDFVESGGEELSASALDAIDVLASMKAFATLTPQATSAIQRLVDLVSTSDITKQYRGLVALSSICESSGSCHTIVKEMSGLVSIVAVLRGTREDLAMLAAQVVGHLSTAKLNCGDIEAAGVVSDLVHLTQSTEKEVRVDAVIAISRMCQHSELARRSMNNQHVWAAAMDAFNMGTAAERTCVTQALALVTEDPIACQTIERSGAIIELLESVVACDGNVRLHAATALANLTANSSESLLTVVHANGVEPLIALLRESTGDVKLEVLKILSNLTSLAPAREVMETTNTVPLLVHLLRDGPDDSKYYTTIVLSHLCQSGVTSIRQLRDADGVEPLVKMLKWVGNPQRMDRLHVAVSSAISVLVAAGVVTSSLLRQESVIPVLIDMLTSHDGKQQEKIADVLATLCEHELDCRTAVQEANGIELLVLRLASGNADVRAAAARALGWLARTATVCRAMETNGVVTALTRIILEDDLSATNVAAIALSVMCGQSKDARRRLENERVLMAILSVLEAKQSAHTIHIVRALEYATRDVLICQRVETLDTIEMLVQHVRDGPDELLSLALRVLINLTLHGSDSVVLVTQAGCIDRLVTLLRQGTDETKTLAASLLTNLSTYGPACGVMEATGAVAELVRGLHSKDDSFQLASIHCLRHLCEQRDECCVQFQSEHGVQRLVGMLRSPVGDSLMSETVKTLSTIYSCALTRAAVMEAGVAEILLAILETGPPTLREAATPFFSDLTTDDSSDRRFRGDVVDVLVQLLSSSSDSAKEAALMLLPRFAGHFEDREEMIASGAVTKALELAEIASISVKIAAVQALAGFCAHRDMVHDLIRARGACVLLRLLHDMNPRLAIEAAQTLLVMSADENACFRMVQAGAVAVLIDIMESGGPVRAAAVRILTRLAEVIWMHDVDHSLVALLLDDLQDNVDALKSSSKKTLATIGKSEMELLSAVSTYVSALVDRLRDGSPRGYESTLQKLKLASASRVCINPMIQAGGVDLLLAITNGSDEKDATVADGILFAIARDPRGARVLVGRYEWCEVVGSGRRFRWACEMLLYSVKNESALLFQLAAGLSELLDLGLVDSFPSQAHACFNAAWSSLAGHNDEHVQHQCSRLVEQLAKRTQVDDTEHRASLRAICRLATHKMYHAPIVAAGAVHVLVTLLCQSDACFATEAAIALASLAEEDEAVRNEIVYIGGAGALVEMARVGEPAQQSAAVATLASLARSSTAGRAMKLLGGDDALEQLTSTQDVALRIASRRALRVLDASTRTFTTETETNEGISERRDEDTYSDSYCSGESDTE